ncbi:MAG: twin-arginine translocase subunit TatC [Bacillota bacterium]
MSGEKEMTLIQHLEEFRKVLIVSILATFVSAVACWVISDRILGILLDPVTRTGNEMVFIGVTEALMTKIKICLFLGFLLALPIILWQFWGFIMPALYKTEKIYFTFFIVLSYIFFIGGVLFSFLFVLRFALDFLLALGGPALVPMLTIDKYISFTIMLLLPFGLVFELPLSVFLLAKMNLLSYEFMAKKRKMAIVVIVVISAAIVPSPDIITPLLMAAPMYLIYEASASVVKLVEWKRKREALKRELGDRYVTVWSRLKSKLTLKARG